MGRGRSNRAVSAFLRRGFRLRGHLRSRDREEASRKGEMEANRVCDHARFSFRVAAMKPVPLGRDVVPEIDSEAAKKYSCTKASGALVACRVRTLASLPSVAAQQARYRLNQRVGAMTG